MGQIQEALLEVFRDKWKPLAARMRKLARERTAIAVQLRMLQTLFGPQPVTLMMAEEGFPQDILFGVPASLGKATDAVVKQLKKAAKEVKPARAVKKRKTKCQKVTFSELKPFIVEAINQSTYQGGRFTAQNVIKWLKVNKKINFQPSHVFLIISRNIMGIKRIGKEKTSGSNGHARVIFKVQGPVGIKSMG